MRLQKTDVVAGLPATVARDVVRIYRGNPRVAESAGDILTADGVDDIKGVFALLKEEGYLEVDHIDEDGVAWWQTTTKGNALAMASFGKPITRKTADRLVAGMLERARSYNADPAKPLAILRIRIFGSYLNPQIDPLGDVDVELTTARRPGFDPFAYGQASGKNFGSFIDHVMWADVEVARHLANRSVAINITTEDVDLIGAQTTVIYELDDDKSARPADVPAQPRSAK